MSSATSSPAKRNLWLWQPNLIVFVSSACIMVIELVAGRMIAPHVGSSLYTWTSVIGVVLAGISLGNYIGGMLADKWGSLRLLGIVYFASALTSLGILAMDRLDPITPLDIPIVAEIVLLTGALFLVPCTILGMISPIVAKLAVSDLAKTGSTVGMIYAAGAAGSIVGTFLTGFVLISWFGTYAIVWGVAGILFVMGLLFLLAGRWQAMLLSALIVAGASTYASNDGWLKGPCVVETNYFCIKLYDIEEQGHPVRQLVLDHLVHSFVQLDDPKHLVYGYEKIYAEVAQSRKAYDPQLSVLMIGGGGYTFARYMDAEYPGSEMHVVEIDPGVTQVAYDRLALNREAKIVTFNEDARLFFTRPPNRKYDLILGDAFNHYSVPYHLTTKEFNDRVRAWLADDGMYVVNIIDGARGEFVRAYYYTLTKTFKYVYLAEGNPDWRHASRSFFVLVGADKELDLNAVAQFDGGDGDALFARTLASDERIRTMLNEAPLITLTDDYVPVDQMLASVHSGDVPNQ
ncbi:MAG: fused MFS/spermidine synthase [Chloroflexi bacterium]|nr:fused MFS/spermidine synthase [Chloroflexota bacterium]